jgi:hypothetical protein
MMQYQTISRVATWLSRVGAGMGVLTLALAVIVPQEALTEGFLKLTLWFAFGSLTNLGFAKWCSLAAAHQARENRRKQWLKDTRR